MVSDASIRGCAPPDGPILFLSAELVAEQDGQAFVAIVRSKDEFLPLLRSPPVGLQWLQVEGLLGDPDA